MNCKKIAIAVMAIGISLSGFDTQARDIKDLLKGLAAASDSTGSESTSGSKLGALGNLVSGLISTDKVEPESMVGVWNYTSPAVCFKSDNFLQKAGGTAAATAIEEKLEPYYRTAGFTNLKLTINEDLTFTMALRKGALKGTVTKSEDGEIIFNFTALGKFNIGSMTAYVTKSGSSTMSIMFDVSKLVTIIKTLGSISGNSTIKGVSALLESYDGVCAGFKLNKQN